MVSADRSAGDSISAEVAMTPYDNRFAAVMTTLRILVAGLVFGILVMAGFSYLIRTNSPLGDPDVGSMLALVAVFLAVSSLGMSSFILPQVDAVNRKRLSVLESVTEGDWLQVLMTRTIIGAALLEAPALLALIAFMLGGPDWSLALGLILACVIGVLYFPTEDRSRRFIAEQSGAMESERAG